MSLAEFYRSLSDAELAGSIADLMIVLDAGAFLPDELSDAFLDDFDQACAEAARRCE